MRGRRSRLRVLPAGLTEFLARAWARWPSALPATAVAGRGALPPVVVSLVLVGLSAAPAVGQRVTSFQTTTADFDFSASNRSMFSAGATQFFDDDVFNVSLSWPESTFDTGSTFKETIEGLDFGARLEGSTSGDFSFVGNLKGQGGSIEVEYPLRLVIFFPTNNSFKVGDEVRLGAWFQPRGDAQPIIRSVQPTSVFSLNLDIDVDASAAAELCVFDCSWPAGLGANEDGTFNLFPPIDIDDQLSIFRFSSLGGFEFGGPFDVEADATLPDGPNMLPFDFEVFPWTSAGLTGENDVPRYGIKNRTECVDRPQAWNGNIDKLNCAITQNGLSVPAPGCSWGSTTASASCDATLRAGVRDRFLYLTTDVDGLLLNLCGRFKSGKKRSKSSDGDDGVAIPSISCGLDLGVSVVPGEFEVLVDLADLDYTLQLFIEQQLNFIPDLEVTVLIDEPTTYRRGSSAPVATSPDPTGKHAIVFKPGEEVWVKVPPKTGPDPDLPQPLLPAADLNQSKIANTTSFKLLHDLRAKYLEASVILPAVEVSAGEVDVCKFGTETIDFFDIFDDEECEFEAGFTWPGVTAKAGPAFPAADDPDATEEDGSRFYKLDLPQEEFSLVNETGRTLGGFTRLLGTSSDVFYLDPENPSIAVTVEPLESGLAEGTGPVHTLTQDVLVTNTGDVKLELAQVTDAVSRQFSVPGFSTATSPVCPSGGQLYGPVCVLSTSNANVSGNSGFAGVGDVNALDANSSWLLVGGSARLRIAFIAQPGNVYTSKVDAAGTTVLGTTVTSSAPPARHAVFHFEIGPDVLADPEAEDYNAVLPVELLSTADLDARLIDPETVTLERIPAERWSFEERSDGSGLVDLTLKFDRQVIRDVVLGKLGALTDLASQIVRELTVRISEIPLLAEALLGRRDAADPDLIDRADLLGNQNDRLDVGDLRAAVVSAGAPTAAGRGGDPKDRQVIWLSILGNMNDGAQLPFMGEFEMVFK